MLFHVSALFLLIIAAYYDLKKNTVPDFISAIFWLFLGLIGSPQEQSMAILVFASLFLSNLWFGQFYGWADILIMPIWFAIISQFGIVAMSIGMFIMIVYEITMRFYFKKKLYPLMPFLAIGYIACFLYSLTLS